MTPRDQPLHLGPERFHANEPQHLAREGIREQATRGALGTDARTELEDCVLVELAHGGAVRALHVIGEDLEPRPRIGLR